VRAPGLERLWQQVLERMAAAARPKDLAEAVYLLRPLTMTRTELRLEAPNGLALVCVVEEYLAAIRRAVAEVAGPHDVVVEVASRDQGELFPELARRRPERRAAAERAMLNPKYTFRNFIVGASNQFAHAACRAVATQPGDHYNPLFLYGGVGLGKTHLVTAIGHEIIAQAPLARVQYLSCETFMNELISSLRRDRMEDFKQRFRLVDILILDDVHLLSGRERTQEEFFHTFNTLHEHRRQIVLTSDKVPKDIPELEERLRNRFEWGLIADIQPPDLETRMAILDRKAEIEGVALPHDVAAFLAERITSNVRELEGALTRLVAHASLNRRELGVEYAQEVLQSVLQPKPRAVAFDEIANVVCDHFSLRPTDLRSRRRSQQVALPRQVAMYLCRRHMNASYPQIGQLFGRDHSTVIHAVTTVEQRLKADAGLQAVLAHLERTLRGD
jgi:chromosomal replication initiator protein